MLGFGLVLWHINHCRLLNTKSIFIHINIYILNILSLALFRTIWHIDRTLLDATAPSQSGPESDGNERVPHIPQSPSITGASPSYFLVSYPGHLLGECYPSAEMQSVYSAAPADWAG